MKEILYKGVIFDMDGTLVDNIAFHKEAWLNFLHKYGINIDANSFITQNHGTISEMIVRFFGDKLSPEEIYQLGQEKEQSYRSLYQKHIKEIDGLSRFLQKLKVNNIKIGLATMCDTPNIDFTLNGLNIMPYFDAMTGGHEVKNGKPNPEIFLLALQKLGLKSEDCIAFEDSIGGVKSALSAGLKVVGMTSTHTNQELLEAGCFRTINSFREL
ncbi:MAG: HAD family hydrolase [Bacteroidales bacterium]